MYWKKSANAFFNFSKKSQMFECNRKLCYKIPTNESSWKLETGQKISITRIVTVEDIMNFAKLTDDYNPIHINTEKKIVHGALLNGFLSGVLGTNLPGPGTMVIYQLLSYPKPCYAGDTIEITVRVLAARKIIKCGYTIMANSERVVLEGEGKFVFSDRLNNLT